MKAEEDDSINEKLSFSIKLFKNLKFIILSGVALIILGIALFSGDGRSIFLNLYQTSTGQPYKIFSKVDDLYHDTYLTLKEKLKRDNNVDIGQIYVFKKSDKEYQYKVEQQGIYVFYQLNMRENGEWHIFQVNDK